jgi:CrcB protein
MGTVTTWLAVAAGGALGSLARFWLAAIMTMLTGPRFPWGTLLINVLGSFIIGLVAGLTAVPVRIGMHPDVRVFVMVGVCGGFTTFSAFSLQTLELLQSGEIASALGYMAGSLLFCLIAVWAGCLLGRAG